VVYYSLKRHEFFKSIKLGGFSMAKSKAKKMREKMIREGKRNPHADRSTFAHSEMYKLMATKKTKTKQDKLNRIKHKERISAAGYSDDSNRSFLFV
jgi:hypothetical protein